jgi:sugar lactone lactonase YvrE
MKKLSITIAIIVGLFMASCSKKDSPPVSSGSTPPSGGSTKTPVDTIIAGTYNNLGYSGDNGPAKAAELSGPTDMAIDSKGNLYIVDLNNACIRKVDTAGIITTYLAYGMHGYFETNPNYITIDDQDNLYISDDFSSIFKLNTRTGGVVTTLESFEFNNTYGATIASSSMAVDYQGNIYFVDRLNNRLFKANATGTITTKIGKGTQGYSGDGGSDTAAEFNNIQDIAVDKQGNLYIADAGNHCIRKVSSSTGIITTCAGNGTSGNSGDGGAAITAKLDFPVALDTDPQGNIYISDENNGSIRKVTVATGVITKLCDEGPGYFVIDAKGNIDYSAEIYDVIRRISFQ